MSCPYSNLFVRYKRLFTRGQNAYFKRFLAIVLLFFLASVYISVLSCILMDSPVHPEYDGLVTAPYTKVSVSYDRIIKSMYF